MKLHHVAITVNDLEESTNFYVDTFGFSIAKSFGRKDMGAKANFLKLGDFFIELWEFQDSEENADDLDNIKIKGIRHVAFGVDNLDKEVLRLRKKGFTITEPKMGSSGHRYCFTSDPNGVALELYEN